MRIFKTFILFTFSLLSSHVNSQITDALIQEYEDGLDHLVNDIGAVGLAMAIKQGDDIWSGARGISSITDPLTVNHRFALGSITKTIVSACILQMMEEGKLTLNDPIGDYIPSYEHVSEDITIEQLLYHSSGLYDYINNFAFGNTTLLLDPGGILTAEIILENYLLEADFVPGVKQEYSNTNYLILGMIIESISGRPYYEEIRSRFDFDTNYPTMAVPPFEIPTTDLANLWFDRSGTGNFFVDVEAAGLSLNGLFSGASSAGAYAAIPEDVVKWGYDLYSGKYLNAATMNKLLTPHPFGLFGISDYGLGVVIADASCGPISYGHNGSIIYTSNMAYLPDHDLCVVAMTNDGRAAADLSFIINITEEMICLYLENTVSTDKELELESEFRIFPNPVNDFLNIENNSPEKIITVQVLDHLGKEVHNDSFDQFQSFIRLNTSDWTPGTYTIHFSSEREQTFKRVIKL